jgi:glycosyltransferase involved in cell wall biosynthesis
MNVVWPCHRDFTSSLSGGAERTVLEIGRRLSVRGHDVTILSPLGRGLAREEWICGIRVVRSKSFFGPHALLIGHLLRSRKPAIVVEDLAHVLPWMTSVLPRQPCVAFFRHLHRRTLWGQTHPAVVPLLRQIEKLYPLLYHGRSIVVESQSSETDLRELGVDPRRIVRIRPGVNSSLFRPRPRTNRHRVVYFGGLRRYKRPEHAILAFDLLKRVDPIAELVIVGETSKIPGIVSLCQSLNLQSSVRFTGRLSDEDLADLVGSSWVNLHCSIAEGWCYSALEAAASGVPTVGYDVPGLRDSVSNGHSGVLVQDGDIGALASAIVEVVATQDAYSTDAINWARQFSWDESAKRWEAILLDSLEG